MKITDQELEIYARQLILDDFTYEVFESLQKKHVVLIGLGGIGCPVAKYLISTGIKKITLVDDDTVELHNLNRQILFDTKDIGKKKAIIAKNKLKFINPNGNINIFAKKVTKKNLKKIFSNSSLIIDTTDSWQTMLLVNKYCVTNNIPLISASALGYDGQVILFDNNKDSHLCLSCIYPSDKEPELSRCENVGILGTTAGITGIIAAQTAINFLTGIHNNIGKLVLIKSKSLEINHISISANKNCILKNIKIS